MTTAQVTVDANGSLNVEQLFNFFMQQTEPDLMRENVNGLNEKYANESDKEKKARGKRYKKAMQSWQEFFATFLSNLKETLSSEKRGRLAKMEAESQQLEEEELARLEAMFDDL